MEQILALLKKVFRLDDDFNRKVETGDTIVPYQEVTLTIPAGGREIVYQVYDYFRVLAQSGGTLVVAFGQNGREVPYQGAGVGYRCPVLFDRVTLINTGGTSMTITIGLANGQIYDDRLNVSGVVNVAGTVTVSGDVESLTTTNAFNHGQVSVAATATLIKAANASRRSITILNNDVNDLYVGNSGSVTTGNGFIVKSGSALTLNYNGAIYGIAASGTIATAYAEDEI